MTTKKGITHIALGRAIKNLFQYNGRAIPYYPLIVEGLVTHKERILSSRKVHLHSIMSKDDYRKIFKFIKPLSEKIVYTESDIIIELPEEVENEILRVLETGIYEEVIDKRGIEE